MFKEEHRKTLEIEAKLPSRMATRKRAQADLISAEEVESGGIKLSDYGTYMSFAGGCCASFFILLISLIGAVA